MSKSNKSFTTRRNMLAAHRLALTSADMGAVLSKESSAFFFSESVNAKIDELKIDTSAIFAVDRNPKVIKRFIQFVHAINAKDYKNVDATTATILYALQIAGDSPLNTDALQYLAAGLKAGRVSPETRGVNRSTVNRLFGRVGLSTVPTQASRTVGKNGFLQLAGATVGEPGKPNQAVRLVGDHPMVKAFFEVMNAATAAQVEEVVGE